MTKNNVFTQYDGCCDTYGLPVMGAIVWGAPILFNMAALGITDNLYWGTAGITGVLSLVASSKGMDAACDSHFSVQRRESRNNTPQSEGAEIVRSEQKISFLKKIWPILAFNVAVLAPGLSYVEERVGEHKGFDSKIGGLYQK